MNYHRLFTLEDARNTLRELRPLLEEMMALKAECDRKGYDVYRHQYFGGMGPNGQKTFPQEMERLAELAARFEEEGVEVKDIEKGLIDFPCRRMNGEIVLLCYLHGEPDIAAWHTVEGGFKGRRGVDSL